ncbi:alpha/beta hydrolase [Flavobacterium noncentrifugens]|nr:alpha/beta hydrolase [Flavobacterium noncentrifugens]
MIIRLSILSLLTLFLMASCASKKIKDVCYISANLKTESNQPKLNIFTKRKLSDKKMPVLIFVHGGNWNTGNKDQYGFFGRNFAKKGIVTIIPDYTLSSDADYKMMTRQVAEVILWAKANVQKYGGDTEQIYITGHSAGGHLAALATLDPQYGIKPGAISGIILNDAAGLDMKNYLEENPPTETNNYDVTWGKDPSGWRNASPVYYLDENAPPFLIYIGQKTYPSIKVANERFLKRLHGFQPKVKPISVNKSHVPMILQYIFPWSDRYKEVIDFMKIHKKNAL